MGDFPTSEEFLATQVQNVYRSMKFRKGLYDVYNSTIGVYSDKGSIYQGFIDEPDLFALWTGASERNRSRDTSHAFLRTSRSLTRFVISRSSNEWLSEKLRSPDMAGPISSAEVAQTPEVFRSGSSCKAVPWPTSAFDSTRGAL